MWMTLSSRANVRSTMHGPLSIAIAAVLNCYPVLGSAAQIAPDAPRPAPSVTETKASIVERRPAKTTSVELKSVSVRRPDATQKKMVGAEFMKQATEPLMIEVVVQTALPSQPRTSSPIIVVNGERLTDTWVVLPDKLVAFLPNRSLLKDVNKVEVMWLGNEKATLTRQPLTFKRSELTD